MHILRLAKAPCADEGSATTGAEVCPVAAVCILQTCYCGRRRFLDGLYLSGMQESIYSEFLADMWREGALLCNNNAN